MDTIYLFRVLSEDEHIYQREGPGWTEELIAYSCSLGSPPSYPDDDGESLLFQFPKDDQWYVRHDSLEKTRRIRV